MGCIKKVCLRCIKETIHNESGKKDGTMPRCTQCAQPYGTGPKAEKHKMMAKLIGKS